MDDKDAVGKEGPDGEVDLTYTLTYKDVVDILEVIDRCESRELRLEVGDLKLTLIKG
jgi:hypothetical protein